MFFLINPLNAKFTKWPNTHKQFVGKLPTNCLSVFGHFLGLALKGLRAVLKCLLRDKLFLMKKDKTQITRHLYKQRLCKNVVKFMKITSNSTQNTQKTQRGRNDKKLVFQKNQ